MPFYMIQVDCESSCNRSFNAVFVMAHS